LVAANKRDGAHCTRFIQWTTMVLLELSEKSALRLKKM
jgi:hypothetical protein